MTRPGVAVRLRTVLLAAIFAFTTFFVEAAPVPTGAPDPRPAALRPEPVQAAFCASNAAFTGVLTASSASTTAVTNITNPTVYGYISNVDAAWSCTAYYRYSAVAWNTSSTVGTFNWGNLINSVSVACNFVVGSTDYVKANSTTDCPDTDAEYAMAVTLSPQGVYVADSAHNGTGDFSFTHADCGTYYGAEPVISGQSFSSSNVSNRPGSNCDPITIDSQGTAQTVTYDSTAPTGSVVINSGAAYTNTTAASLTLSASDSVAGLGDMRFSNDNVAWSAWEPYTTSKAWTLSSGDGTKTVYVQYRDLNGNASGSFSDTIVLDTTPGTPNPPDSTCTTTASVYQGTINGTCFFRPAAASTLTLTGTVTDPQSGIQYLRFQNLSPTTGWTPSPVLPNNDTASPYTESLGFSASAGTSTIQILARNGAGTDTSARTVNLTADSAGPTASFSVPASGTTSQPSDRIGVTWTESDGTGSGVASRSLKRQMATYTAGACGAFTDDPAFTPTSAASPVVNTGLLVNTCYRWVQTLTDRVGNSLATTSGVVVRDTTANLGQQRQHTFESWDLGGGDGLAVNTANGNLVVSHPIVSLPIRGGMVDLALTYNSQDAANVGMGPGWRLDVFRRLALNADGTVTFIDADGARYTFTNPVTNGTVTTYTRPAALYATLVKDTALSANEFVLTYRDQSKDKFDVLGSEGILVREEDRFGNGVTVAYSAGTNRISTITDTAASRAIDFAWDASNRLSQITDWAWIDGSGVVQATTTGARRTYRFFYDASSRLAGWSDPLNTAGSCPTGGSHLTCVAYPTNGLDIAKTQTVTTAGATALSSTTRVITSKVTFTGSNVATVKDAEQVALAGPATTFTQTSAIRLDVARPTTSTGYGLVSQNDAYARVQSIWRDDTDHGVEIERRTTWNATYPTEPATVTDNYGALLSTPARTVSFTYVASSLGLVSRITEPLTATDDRWTDFVYNANNDVTQRTVSLEGSPATITRYCYTTQSLTCPTTETGLTLVRQIDNWVSSGPQDDDTNVATDFVYDAYGQQTRVQRHNRDTASTVLDDRTTGFVYDTAGNLTAEITNYVDGVVTNATTDTTPGADSVRTDLTTTHAYDTAGNRISSADPRRAIGLVIPSSTQVTFTPTDDAHVRDANPTTNYGSDTTIQVRASGGSQSAYEPFLMFAVTGIVGTITSATLRLDNTATANKSTRDVCVYRVPSTTWTEGAITWNTKPASDASSTVCVHGDQAAGPIDYDLGTTVPGPGLWAFRLTNSTTFDVVYASSETTTETPPQLILTVSYGPLGADDYVSRSTYDALNERLTEKTPTTYGTSVAQKTSTTKYDELEAVREATDFSSVTTGSEFDRSGRATKAFEDTDPASGAPVTTSISTFDADGRALTGKDRAQVANGALGSTTNDFDALGRHMSATMATGTADESTTLATYDGLDRLTILNVGGQEIAYTFDLGGRTLTTDDDFACSSSTYDYRDLVLTTTTGLAGGTCSTSGAQWRTVTRSSDGLGRAYRAEQTSSYNSTGDGDRTHDDVFDAAGNRRSSASRKSGVTTTSAYTVTILDHTITEARPDGSTAKSTFDPAGNPSDRCYWKPGASVGDCKVVGTVPWTNPPTQSTSTVFDARNNRIQQVDGLTNQITTYDPDHNYQPKAVYLPTGSGRELQSLYTYDARHRLTGITHQTCVLSNVTTHACSSTTAAGSDTYAYDENDNRTRVNESNGSASSDRYYCYDARDQLTKMAAAAGCATPTESYSYDDAGNRLTAPGRTFTYSVDGQLTACTGPTCSVTYDSAGRTASWTENGVTWSYLYDSGGRLTSACKAASCSGSGFDRLDMTYDGEGHRTNVVETPAAGSPVTTREFRYQGNAVVEETVNGSIVRTTIVDEGGTPTKVVVTNSGAANGTYVPTWNGHGDLLALWRVDVDGTLTLANSVTYDTWGRPTVSTHNGIANLGWSRLYVGQFDVWWDDTFGAGLLYMHARHYSPTLGRFLQPDPTGSEGNLYGYSGNSPVSNIDPSGELFWAVIIAVAIRIAPLVARAVSVAATASQIPAIRQAGQQLAAAITRTPAPNALIQAWRLTHIINNHSAWATVANKSHFFSQYWSNTTSTQYLIQGAQTYIRGFSEIAVRTNGYTVVTQSQFPYYVGYTQSGQLTRWVTYVWRDGYLWTAYPGLP